MDTARTKQSFDNVIAFFKKELDGFRTGRASPALVEHLRVDYYGTATPLQQLATISTPESRLLLIEAWDPVAVPSIEKAILQSDLGLNPAVDGQRIRLPLPQLTEERRQELVKLAKQKAEAARVSIRSIREEIVKDTKRLEKDGELSEDQAAMELKELQKLVDTNTTEVENLLKKKEEDILRI